MQFRYGRLSCLNIACAAALLFPTLALAAAQVPPSAPVTVVNTPANPVPVTGSTIVSGSVTVNNSSSSPVPVTGTVGVMSAAPLAVRDAGIGTPFEGNCGASWEHSENVSCKIDIPAGNQLVIQAVSAIAGVDPGRMPTGFYIQQWINGSSGGHRFPMVSQGTIPFGSLGIFVGSQSITWYFDPAATKVVCAADLTAAHTSDNANSFYCTVTGYLVPKS